MTSILYFAYGSNMLEQRLQKRCRSARAIGAGWAEGYSLAFSKKSKDGSGKATLAKAADPASRVYGVIFSLDLNDQDALDREEGQGYERVGGFRITAAPDAKPLDAITYIARQDRIETELFPYDWYLNLVIAGAEQADLPEDYIDHLRRAQSAPDPDPDRPTHIQALRLLKSIGYSP